MMSRGPQINTDDQKVCERAQRESGSHGESGVMLHTIWRSILRIAAIGKQRQRE